MDPYRLWLRDALDRLKPTGKSRSGLARHLGKEPSAVTKMLRQDSPQKIPVELLPKIVDYLGIPLPDISLSRTSRTIVRAEFRGVLAVGVWFEGVETPTGKHFVPAVPDPSYSDMQQYTRLVQTQTIDKVPVGDYCIFVDYASLRPSPRSGDLVHIRRKNGTLVENSLRRVRVSGGAVTLEADTGPAAEHPLSLRDCEIVGLLLGVYRPSPDF